MRENLVDVLTNCYGEYGEVGAVDFAEVGRVSNAAGFYGPVNTEVERIRGEPLLMLRQPQDRLQRSADRLREVGILY